MAEPIRSPRKLLPVNLCADGFGNRRWQAYLPDGYTLEDALRPQFWAHVANQMKSAPGERKGVGDIIEIRNFDHSAYAELYVRGVGDNEVFVAVMVDRAVAPEIKQESAALDVRWNVGKRGYDIVRVGDKAVVQDGAKFPLREQAVAWIAQHAKAMAA